MYVRLQRDWTDSDGVVHAAGETVDVDVSTLAQLESSGVVSDPNTGDEDGAGGEDSAGGEDDGAGDPHSWVGPTGDPDG